MVYNVCVEFQLMSFAFESFWNLSSLDNIKDFYRALNWKHFVTLVDYFTLWAVNMKGDVSLAELERIVK